MPTRPSEIGRDCWPRLRLGEFRQEGVEQQNWVPRASPASPASIPAFYPATAGTIWRGFGKRRSLANCLSSTTKTGMRLLLRHGNPRGLPSQYFDDVYQTFDRGTKRAVLRLYRNTRDTEEGARQLTTALRPLDLPALIVWGAHDPYIPVGVRRAPASVESEWKQEIGIAVPRQLFDRWSYVLRSSRRRLPELLHSLATWICLFMIVCIARETLISSWGTSGLSCGREEQSSLTILM
jgi:pimeloyl-ACP methyl ester carboxylesterase